MLIMLEWFEGDQGDQGDQENHGEKLITLRPSAVPDLADPLLQMHRGELPGALGTGPPAQQPRPKAAKTKCSLIAQLTGTILADRRGWRFYSMPLSIWRRISFANNCFA